VPILKIEDITTGILLILINPVDPVQNLMSVTVLYLKACLRAHECPRSRRPERPCYQRKRRVQNLYSSIRAVIIY